jgi:hypothetical protein
MLFYSEKHLCQVRKVRHYDPTDKSDQYSSSSGWTQRVSTYDSW